MEGRGLTDTLESLTLLRAALFVVAVATALAPRRPRIPSLPQWPPSSNRSPVSSRDEPHRLDKQAPQTCLLLVTGDVSHHWLQRMEPRTPPVAA